MYFVSRSRTPHFGLDCTHVLALRDGAEVDFHLGLSQDVGRRGHVDKEVYRSQHIFIHQHMFGLGIQTLNSRLCAHGGQGTKGTNHEVLKDAVGDLARVALVLAEAGDVCRLASGTA